MTAASGRAASPPSLAAWLVALRVPEAEREYLLGDLEEAFAARVGRDGAKAARRWYWGQAISVATASWPAPLPIVFPQRPEQSMQSFTWDLRQAVRSLVRSPAHSLLAIITLAVGIGSAAALFSIVNPVLLQAPPYPEADRLALVFEREDNGDRSNVGFPTFRDLSRDVPAFASAAAMSFWQPMLQLENDAEELNGQRVSWTYFSTLGVRPALGRDFRPEEDTPATRDVVVLSHGLWQRRFGGDSSLVGRTISISGRSFEVAGIMGPGFENITAPQSQIWTPLGYDESLSHACRSCRHLRMIARLKPGVTGEAAQDQVDQRLAAMRRTFPTEYAGDRSIVQGLHDFSIGTLRPAMLALAGAVVLLLLIACTNVANLVLGRAFERQAEYSLRSALGAATGRLVRQVTGETLVLAIAGGAGGLTIAVLVMRLLPAGLAAALPRTSIARLDGGVVMFALAATFLSTVLAGVIPALLAVRGSAAGSLRMGARQVTGRTRHRVRAALVVTEVSLAIVLLTGSGLLMRTLGRLLEVRTGFRADGVVTMSVSVSGPRYAEDEPVRAFQRAALDAARGVPGVTGVAFTSQLPLGGNFDGYGIHRLDKPSPNPALDPSAQRFAVSPDYLATMGIQVLQGRGFSAADRAGAAPVALVNRAMAQQVYAGEDVLGRQLRVGGMDGPVWTVVGVVDDVRHLSLEATPESQVYVPWDQWSWSEGSMVLVARSSRDAAQLMPAIEAAVRKVDPTVAISAQSTMQDVVMRSTASRQLALYVIGAFALIALVLSAAGMFGVIAASVAERTREIGVRSALGATRGSIVGLVVRQGAAVSAIGLVIGTAGAIATGLALRSMLYGVAPWDLPTVLGVVAVLAVVAVVACALPAWRAARVDPVTALREG